MNSEFYTLTSYLHQKKITYAMEDYIEMLYRKYLLNEPLTITKLSKLLHIKKSSCSKMISKLITIHLVSKDNYLKLTKEGLKIGKYLYYRHEILTNFLTFLNKDKYKLEQVEKIEHFIDPLTLKNLNELLKKTINYP